MHSKLQHKITAHCTIQIMKNQEKSYKSCCFFDQKFVKK